MGIHRGKFWKKLHYCDDPLDVYKFLEPDQIKLPDAIMKYVCFMRVCMCVCMCACMLVCDPLDVYNFLEPDQIKLPDAIMKYAYFMYGVRARACVRSLSS